MAYTNKETAKKCRDKWYRENKQKQIDKQMERRRWLKDILQRLKSFLCCADCGMSFRGKEECCDFHHLDPSKKEMIVLDAVCSSKQKLKKELAKCVAICSNCHRTRHKNDIYRSARR